MTEESKKNTEGVEPTELAIPDNSVRARNRTVLLTANVTEDLRSRLSGDSFSAPAEARLQDELQQFSGSSDWESVLKAREGGGQGAITLGAELSGVSTAEVHTARQEDPISFNAGRQEFDDIAQLEVDFLHVSDAADFVVREQQSPAGSRIVRGVASTADYRFDETAIGMDTNPSFQDFEPDGLHSESFETPDVALNAPRPDAIYWREERELIGFLVSYDYNANGSYVEFRKGRLVISREVDNLSDCFVIDSDSVGILHAIVRIEDSRNIKILDQLSEFGTRVIRRGEAGAAASEICLLGEKLDLQNGDILCFGDRRFHLCLIPRECD